MKKLIVIVCILLAAQSVFAQKADIRYNLKKGEKYAQEMITTTKTTQNIMGMTMNTDLVIGVAYTYAVLGVSGDVYELEVSYTRVSLDMQTPYGNMSHSTDGAEIDPVNARFKSMLGSPFRLKMNSKGEASDFRGLDELIESVAAKSSASAAEKEAMKLELEQSFGQQAMKSSFELSSRAFPVNPVSPGDRWNMDVIYPSSGMDLNMNIVYQYKGIEDGQWIIHADGVITIPEGTKMNVEGIQMDVEMSGRVTYIMKIDTKTGWPTHSAMEMPLEGNISAEIPGQGRMAIGLNSDTSAVINGYRM